VKAIIYHNPRCSKSRQTLALLEERGVDVEVVEYLKDTPDAATLRGLMKALGKPPREVIRRGEAPFAELGLATRLDDDDALIAAIATHPVLLERPIVVVGKRAVIGRPPENVLVLFDPVQ
jgi:arsenate reductase